MVKSVSEWLMFVFICGFRIRVTKEDITYGNKKIGEVLMEI